MAVTVKPLPFIPCRKGCITTAKEHVKYMNAPREHHRNNPNLFDAVRDHVNRREFFDRLEQQKPSPHHAFMHKFIIALSEEERDRLQIDLRELARDTMARYETKTGRQFDWVAAIHDDAGHPHVHVSYRGRDLEGKTFFVGPKQLRDLRQIAEQEKIRQAERTLGQEKAHEINRELQQKAADRQAEKEGGDRQQVERGLGQDIVQGLSAGFMRMLNEAEYEQEQARRRAEREAQRKRKKRKQQGLER